MADMVQLPTVMENGFGGAGMGAGFIGGLVLGSIWNGNGFGFGGNRAGAAVADVGLANAIEHVGDAVNQGTISGLQSTNQLSGQMYNTSAAITSAMSQNTVAGLQSNAALSDKICGATMNLAGQIDSAGDATVAAINQGVITGLQTQMATNDRLCGINNNITSQGFENRLQAQALAAQLQNQHAQLSAQIASENCQDRELMREIASQAVRDKLAESQAKVASLEAQINLQQQLTNQTLYLVNQLKPETTTPTTGA